MKKQTSYQKQFKEHQKTRMINNMIAELQQSIPDILTTQEIKEEFLRELAEAEKMAKIKTFLPILIQKKIKIKYAYAKDKESKITITKTVTPYPKQKIKKIIKLLKKILQKNIEQ